MKKKAVFKVNVLQKSRKEKSVVNALKSEIATLKGLCEKPKWFKSGWMDCLVFIPGGFLWLVECKRPVGGKISARQKLVCRELQELHFKVRYVWDRESLKIFIDEIKRTING